MVPFFIFFLNLSRKYIRYLKGHSQLWDRADLNTSCFYYEKSSPQPGINFHLEIRSNFLSVMPDF